MDKARLIMQSIISYLNEHDFLTKMTSASSRAIKVDKYGKIDILINNAGVSRFKNVYELTVDDWDDVLNSNLRGTFLCSKEAAKYMKKNKSGGSIVNISSTRATMSEKNSEAYAASKGGILSLTHALALSLSDNAIQVNAISPGWIETGDYNELSEIDHKQHPSQRVGKPEDIAPACLFLTNKQNNFITGENLVIDGGMTKKMIYKE
ncbi:SDR family oxidoreductase [Bacillus sp. FJAT-45350]|uniref:SDR family oxidoreductase n=1 Tax=Bacillus sp. FJAT-45350 TaxID=2011014 RepID=UPI000BB8FFD5|nr:SDR family oxidoreductase [Bacillus sp. FJAT-45350]